MNLLKLYKLHIGLAEHFSLLADESNEDGEQDEFRQKAEFLFFAAADLAQCCMVLGNISIDDFDAKAAEQKIERLKITASSAWSRGVHEIVEWNAGRRTELKLWELDLGGKFSFQ